MTRRWSEMASEHLVDHGSPEQLDRVWKRLESNLSPARPRAAGGAVRWWLPAGAVAVFGLGVLVGAVGLAPEPAARVTPMAAEPTRVVEPTARPAAGGPDELESSRGRDRESNHRTSRSRRAVRLSARAVPSGSAAPLAEGDEAAAELTIAGPPEWQLLADDGAYDRALASVEAAGGFDAVLSEATAEQLMLLVDVARATGQRARAVEALRAIVNLHGSDPNAPVAAWMLGNELMKLGDPHGAAQAFAMYRALSPQGDFAEDALARQFEVATEQGHLKHARALAEQYAKDFPNGPRGAEIRDRLARLEQQATSAAADGGLSARDATPGALASSPLDGGLAR